MSDIIILTEPAHCFALTAREAEEEINKNFMANVDAQSQQSCTEDE